MNVHQFLPNKWTKIYFKLIENARNRVQSTELKYESHHVLPKSFGGTEVVNLTIREHFIAHRLLIRMTEGDDRRKMSFALWRMCNDGRRKIHSSRMYSEARNLFVETVKITNKRPKTDSEKRNMSIAAKKRWESIDQTGAKNPVFNGFFVTPAGKFDSAKAVNEFYKCSVSRYCIDPDRKIISVRSKSPLTKSQVGMSYREAGFYKE